MTKLLRLGILFSTAVRAAVAAKLVILGILPLKSFILALREALVAKFVILGISFLISFILALRAAVAAKLKILGLLSSISLILASYTSFLTTFLLTASLDFFKSTGAGFNLPASNSADLSISNLSRADFKLAKSSFLASFYVSTPAASFKSDFVA